LGKGRRIEVFKVYPRCRTPIGNTRSPSLTEIAFWVNGTNCALFDKAASFILAGSSNRTIKLPAWPLPRRYVQRVGSRSSRSVSLPLGSDATPSIVVLPASRQSPPPP